MEIKPTPKQAEAHRIARENFFTLYGGAIRGGKSYWGCLEIISLCFEYPNSRWVMVRATLPTMKRTLLVTFQSFLNKGLDQYVESFNQQSLTLTWNNGSQIIFMAESFNTDKELNRFRGLEINGGFIDEINEVQEQTLNKLIERSGSWFHSPNCPSHIFASCNPTQGWVKERFFNQWKINSLPSGFAYIPAKITDNPHIPQDYLNTLKLLPKYEYEVFVNGNWDVNLKTGGEFYKSFELDKHIAPIQYDPSLPLHVSFDFNVNPYITLIIIQVEGKHIKVIDEILLKNPKNNTRALCKEFVIKYGDHDAGVFIYGDPSGRQQDTRSEQGFNDYTIIYSELSKYNPVTRVREAAPSVMMRGRFINAIFEMNYADLSIVVNESCTVTINDFVSVKEQPDGTKHKQKQKNTETGVTYEIWGHTSDAFDYFITGCFFTEFTSYSRGAINTSAIFGKRATKQAY